MPRPGDEAHQIKSFWVLPAMDCLKCKGFMMVERHYTLMNRRLYARCLNCGFWIDLADLLRFFHKVIDSGFRGTKVRESFTL
jgi:hypothetical protein